MNSYSSIISHQSSVTLFPGSFDPFTIGHADIVKRALDIFDRVVVAIVVNVEKKGLLTIEISIAYQRHCL